MAGANVCATSDISIDDPARSDALRANARAQIIVAVPHPKDVTANDDMIVDEPLDAPPAVFDAYLEPRAAADNRKR